MNPWMWSAPPPQQPTKPAPASPPIDPVREWITRRLSADPGPKTILELGANVGQDTAWLAAIPGATVHAFEADPRNRSASPLPGNVRWNAAAVGDRDGTVALYPSGAKGRAWTESSSICKPTGHLTEHPWVTFGQPVDVPCVRLDTYAQANDIGEVAFVWADVQGAEKLMLAGGADTFTRAAFLYTEFSDAPLYDGQPTLNEILALLPGWRVIAQVEDGNHNALLCRSSLPAGTRVEILIVSYAADAWWLKLCLDSINKYARGFARVVVAYPRQDEALLRPICQAHGADAHPFNEMPGKGHLCQNLIKCLADVICPEATHVLHMDSDCVFVEPAIPEDYFADGRPILWRRSYAGLFAQTDGAWQAAFRLWQENVTRALGWSEEWETMARQPLVFTRETYAATRARIEEVHGQPFIQWVMSQPCEFGPKGERIVQPGFVEFDTLGSVALHDFADRYEVRTIPDDVHTLGLPTPWPGAEPWALPPRPRMRQFMSNELRQPGGVSKATLNELRSYGLAP